MGLGRCTRLAETRTDGSFVGLVRAAAIVEGAKLGATEPIRKTDLALHAAECSSATSVAGTVVRKNDAIVCVTRHGFGLRAVQDK